MNRRQIVSLQTVTNRINRSARLSTIDAWMNGPVCFKTEDMPDGSVMLSAFTPENAWFETHCHALFFIGVRGGVRLTHCEGFNRKIIA